MRLNNYDTSLKNFENLQLATLPNDGSPAIISREKCDSHNKLPYD